MAKQILTFRVDKNNLEHLKSIAAEQNVTVSKLVDMAVEEFLESNQKTDFCISPDDIKHIAPVIDTFGKEMPLKLFIQIIKAQR